MNSHINNNAMITTTLPISKLFQLISEFENKNFTPEQEQYLDSPLNIMDERGEWVKINAAITKQTTGRRVAFTNGDNLSAADKHLVHDGDECVYLDSLRVGDSLVKADGTEIEVASVSPINDTLFYDLSVVSDTHLYQTTNGIINHNTELARALSEHLDMPLLKYDMSEYGEKFSAATLIGAPPGYAGYGESNLGGGKLINDLSKNPYSILLFDEVEKAHPDIYNLFLQLLDEGRITGANGKTVNAKNTIIIMTSNLGSADSERNNIGFGNQSKSGEDDKALKEFFKPELRNRIDQICKFGKLDTFAIKKIVVKFVNELKASLKSNHNLSLNLTESAIEHLATVGYDSKMGARPLSRKIDELIRVPLSKRILFERLKNASITATLVDDKIEFMVTESTMSEAENANA